MNDLAIQSLQAIITLMPKHNVYIETYLGDGEVFLAKPHAKFSIGIDSDEASLAKVMSKTIQQGYAGETRLISDDVHTFLRNYEFNGDELVYCAPPYMMKTRKSNQQYAHDISDDRHLDLLTILKGINAKVILSGFKSKIYDDYLPDWNTYDFSVITSTGSRDERIWYNYELKKGLPLNGPIRNIRKIKTESDTVNQWCQNYRELPADQRKKILSALLKIEAELI